MATDREDEARIWHEMSNITGIQEFFLKRAHLCDMPRANRTKHPESFENGVKSTFLHMMYQMENSDVL